MNAEQLSYLLYKYIAGELTAEEREFLETWLQQDAGNQVLFDKMVHAKSLEQGIKNEYRVRASSEKVLKEVLHNIESLEASRSIFPSRFSFLKRTWFRYAAVFVIIAGTVAYILATGNRYDAQKIVSSARQPVDISIGNEKAILTLSDGTKMELASSREITIADGSLVIRNDNGTLNYPSTGSPVINTISTPRGGQYSIVFADGTRVWMNSASSLTYPTIFTGKERVVELKGQAYFEVSKVPGQPFKVKANGVEVDVLGTHFDVMAYNDETFVNTTLIEGSVRVNNGKTPVIIEPGQQAVFSSVTQNISVQEADINSVMAWKNGLFVFNNASLQRILSEIARWYDVDIINNATNSSELYGGSISRQQKLADVLELLEAGGSCQFKIEGRKVIVQENIKQK